MSGKISADSDAGVLGGSEVIPVVAGGLNKTTTPTRLGAFNVTAAKINTALGYTPYNAANPAGYIDGSALNASNLSSGTIPAARLPSIAVVEYLGSAADEMAMLALAGQKGDWCTRTDNGKVYVITGADPTQASDWTALSYPASVASPGGSDTQVQFNDGDTFGGDAGLTFDKTTSVLGVAGAIQVSQGVVLGDISAGHGQFTAGGFSVFDNAAEDVFSNFAFTASEVQFNVGADGQVTSLRLDGDGAFLPGAMHLGVGPFPSSGAIQLGESSDGIWSYATGPGDVALARITTNGNGFPQVSIGNSGFGNQVNFDFYDSGAIYPESGGVRLGTPTNRFESAYFSSTLFLGGGSLATTGGIRSPAGIDWFSRNAADDADDGVVRVGSSIIQFGADADPFPSGRVTQILGDTIILYPYAHIYFSSTSSAFTGAIAYSIPGGDPGVAAFWADDIAGKSENPYYQWYDSRGVYRIREDNVADGSGNPQAVPALYNPRFTKYTPGAVDFERIVQQWNTNVAEIGPEAGGTGVQRDLRLLGAAVNVPSLSASQVVMTDGSKNFVSQAGANFGPAMPTSITVVNGVVTAIA